MVLGTLVVIGVFIYARMTVEPEEPDHLFTYADEQIVESSGLAASAVHEGIVYTHNDSDDRARIFAVDQTGETVAVITLRATEARDWEAIAVGKDDDGEPAIFVGDIGDNVGGGWSEVWIYRIAEPDVLENASVKPTRFRLTYEDGPRNAEALLIDPRDNRIYVASKEEEGGGLYRAPEEMSVSDANELERIADVPALVTDGAFAPDGERFVLRDYVAAHVYDKPGHKMRTVLLPFSSQGESITYTADGTSWLVGSEGPESAVWRVPGAAAADERTADETVAPTVEPTIPGDDADEPSGGSTDGGSLVLWGNVLALAVAAAAFVGLVRVIRQRRQKPS